MLFLTVSSHSAFPDPPVIKVLPYRYLTVLMYWLVVTVILEVAQLRTKICYAFG